MAGSWLAEFLGLPEILVDDVAVPVEERRAKLNLIPGSGVTIVGVDNEADERIDVTFSAPGAAMSAPADPADDGKVAIAASGDLSYALLANANVAAAAAIAGTKVAPDFGAQDVATTGLVSYGGGASQADGSVNVAIQGKASLGGGATITLLSFDPTVLLGSEGSVTVAFVAHIFCSALTGYAYVERKARFKILAGTITQIGTTEKVSDENELLPEGTGDEYTVDIDVSAGSIRVRTASINEPMEVSGTGSWVGSSW
jgi:hypothetical protein